MQSPHASGAWIEGMKATGTGKPETVAPREWGVD
jgi:hypothetical protein